MKPPASQISCRLGLVGFAFVALIVGDLPATALATGDDDDTLQTSITVLVGTPDVPRDEASNVVIVPGTVVLAGSGDVDESVDLALVRGRLQETYRLETLEMQATEPLTLGVDETEQIHVVGLDVTVDLTLLGYDESVATYRLRIVEGGTVQATPTVSVERGGRAVVGGRDADGRSYFFLLVAPSGSSGEVFKMTDDFEPPRLIEKVQPVYPEEARESRTGGAVIIRGVIGKDGTVRDVKVLKSPSGLLSRAAVEAIRQWRYEPARDPGGEPVAVHYTLMVRFTLE
jgi:protein TonB